MTRIPVISDPEAAVGRLFSGRPRAVSAMTSTPGDVHGSAVHSVTISAFEPKRTDPLASEQTMTASVAGRYASALFELARDQNALAGVEADLNAFAAMLESSSDLTSFVRSPVLSSDDQVRALDAILGAVGIGGVTRNFLLLVARNRRLFVLADMIVLFRKLAARARGEVAADVTSALPLTDAQMEALRVQLRAIAGKDVVVAAKVDPSLLGGLIVRIGSRMVDSSLKTKLASLGGALKATA